VKRPLNERQRAVLEWVGKGRPDGVWDSSAYKASCQALQNRGLVKISRRGGRWSAELTDAGTHYLAHGTYPAVAAPTKRLATPQLPRVRASTEAGPAADSPPMVRQPRKSFTEQLLEELEAADGRIVKQAGKPMDGRAVSRRHAGQGGSRRRRNYTGDGAVRATRSNSLTPPPGGWRGNR